MCARISTYLHVFSRHLQMITKAETCISNNVHTLIALSNVACVYIYIYRVCICLGSKLKI